MTPARTFVEQVGEGPQTLSHGLGWVPTKPAIQPLICRIKDAWEVLCGRAEAVNFPGNEPQDPSYRPYKKAQQ